MDRRQPGGRLSWRPQPGPQTRFVATPVFEVIYGGARGGGKTDATLGDFLLHQRRFKAHAVGLFVRRTRVALESTIERAKVLYAGSGAVWREQKSRFVWPSGARLSFRYLDRDEDAQAYQGHAYTRVYVEELTQFVSPGPVDKLKATLRSAAGVPCGFRATCNPGGPGHNWVKARYIDTGPWKVTANADGLAQVFIPARVADNPALLESDPDYVARLRQSGSEALVRAWLEGDWDLVEGAFFDKWSCANIVAPFAIPDFWHRFFSFDWGYGAPFAVQWWTIASDPTPAGGRLIPRGAMVLYREWYGSTGRPNEGLRLTAEAVADGILERQRGETIRYGVADPSIFNQDGGPSIGERLRRKNLRVIPADNTRVGRAGAAGGWDQLRARITGEDGKPMLYVFDTCRGIIRTLPVLQHDPDRMEDLDTNGEDHAADAARYACMSRPMTAKPPLPARARPDDYSQWSRVGIHNDWMSR